MYQSSQMDDADFRASERLANALHREKNQTGKVFHDVTHDVTGVASGRATPLNLFDELEELACGELNVLDSILVVLYDRLAPVMRPANSAPDGGDGECELASEARIAISGLRARVRGQISVLSGILDRLDLP